MLHLAAICWRWFSVLFGIAAIAFGMHQWIWCSSLPPNSFVGRCGNCFVGAVVIPVETAIFGTIIALASIAGVRWRASDFLNLALVAVSIVATLIFIGLPMYAFTIILLAYELIRR